MNHCEEGSRHTLNLGGRLLDLEARPQVMGIVNLTPDSFFSGSRVATPLELAGVVEQMVHDGVDLLDVGACSTRPGSTPPSPEQELARLREGVRTIREVAPDLPISIDTYRGSVAEALLTEFGIELINDISAGEMDPSLIDTVARWHVPYILMHMQGTPTDMQQAPHYEDVTREVMRFLAEHIARLHDRGVVDIIVDPGFGFGKNDTHNYTLLRNLHALRMLEAPILVGMSRKSMINRVLGTTPGEALEGTQAVNTLALLNGANILRVHDVKPAVQAVRIVQKYQQQPVW